MAAFLSLIIGCQILVVILGISYCFSYHQKLCSLKPPAARCYHINRIPSWTSFIPQYILCAITKPRGKPLNHCQLVAPHNLAAARAQDQVADSKGVTFDVDWTDYKEIYEYFSRIEVVIDSMSIDPLHLVAFNKMIRCDSNDNLETVPMCYVLAMRHPLTLYLLMKDEFPISPIGLCRIGVDITFFESLSIDNEYEVSSAFNELRESRKGVEVDITTTIYQRDSSNPSYSKMVLECSESFLSRNSLKMEEFRKYTKEHSKEWTKKRNEWNSEFGIEGDVRLKSIIIPDGVSMEYAKLSGDVLNPFYFWPRNPQIPALWTLQRVITEIKATFEDQRDLFLYQIPIKMVSSFKAPIFENMKSLKLLMRLYPKSEEYLTFALVSEMENGDRCPHVLGSLVPAK